MLKNFIQEVVSTKNDRLSAKIQAHLNDLTKPLGSLGRLEEFAMQYCLCRGSEKSSIATAMLFTFAGDHGITAEKITPFPSEVTTQMVMNMAMGGAAVTVMCKKAGFEYSVVDMGVNADFPDHPLIIKKKVGRGTKTFLNGSAMSSDQCNTALQSGYEVGTQAKADLFGIGEMGIGNSSSAAALYSLLLNVEPDRTTGPGTGSHGDLLERKKRIISDAVAFHRKSWDGTPLEALCRVGGFEIAGMVGLIMGAATKRVPVVVDGFIASSAALVAMRMAPVVKEYLYFSHASAESFHKGFLELEGIRPILDLDMRLGEGTGSVLAMQIIEQAMACYNTMATFSSAGVSNKE